MDFINAHIYQATGIIVVAILLGVGRAKILPHVRGSRVLLWLAWLVTVVCGLILGWALSDLVGWLTSLSGIAGGTIGSLGELIALAFGWHGVYLLVALIRDVADGQPDEDARKAALWVPTALPAGWQAVWGIVTHPNGLATGLTTALMAAITIAYAHLIVKAAIKSKKARVLWLWFAAAVCLLAGLVTTPLVLYLDGVAAQYVPSAWLLAGRIVAGTFGVALAIAAAKDITDKVPDEYVRAFLRFGLPLLIAFGAVAVSTISGHASDGAHILSGSMR